MPTDTQQQMYYGPPGDRRRPDAEEHPDTAARHEPGTHPAPEAEADPAETGSHREPGTYEPVAIAEPAPPTTEPAPPTPEPVAPTPEPAATTAQAPPAAEPMPAILLWDEARTGEYRGRWRDAQLRFVDDPQAAAAEARTLVAEVVDALSTALAERRDRLDDWRTGEASGGDETERLRIAMRRYRDFFERVLGV